MSIRYADGQHNDASGTRDAFGRFSDDLEAEGLPPITVVSGDREPAEQVEFFVSRFNQQASGGGPFGDVRWWDGSAWGYPGGTRWVRWSSAGTVAVPGTGNHEKHRSNDLAWPYNAVTTAHLRAREIAARHNITCDGLGFGEAWHWTYWGALGAIGAPASTNATPFKPEGFLMALNDDEQRELLDGVRQIKGWLRGDQPDVDRLSEIVVAVRDMFKRIRGEKANVDMPQDILGQLEALRSEVQQLIDAGKPAS